MLEDLI